MIFPKYIKKGDTIGVTATSSGIVNELKQKRIKNAIKNFENRGYNVKVTDNVYTSDWRGCSILTEHDIFQQVPPLCQLCLSYSLQ